MLRHPDELERLRDDLSLIPTAVEELLRYESPIQHTARLAPDDIELGGKQIKKDQAVIAVMGAANRDPERFPDPDRLDIARTENRHLAFGWGAHFCFGAPLARIEGQVALETILRRLPGLRLGPDPITWRPNLTLRGLTRVARRVLVTDADASSLSAAKRALLAQRLRGRAPGQHRRVRPPTQRAAPRRPL